MNRRPVKIVDNLGKRHRDLNSKVAEAVANNTDFDDIEKAPESCDIDVLFKIDVAAKQKNVDYIIGILKSSDSLYMTRALKKCRWLFENEYSHIINPEYLNKNIFPFTSMRMKRKILNAILTNVRNEERSAIFFNFCMELGMSNIAFKFLLFTSENFKLSIIQGENEKYHDELVKKKSEYLQNFLGKSFTLFEAYLKIERNSDKVVRKLDYFYKISNDRYLDLLEKYVHSSHYCDEFDPKLSTDLMKKYKARVLAKPSFYFYVVDRKIFKDNITTEDAKTFAAALLPENSYEFWDNFSKVFKMFLKYIPLHETYSFMKKIFNDRYPEREFEMTRDFYDEDYYNFMTNEEQEEWAWRHIKSEKQILGVGFDYKWYEFVNFKDAFKAVKHLISITQDSNKRKDMTLVLIRAAKNNNELETLLVYYEKRHKNEARETKENFLNDVINHHNVFEFHESCWNVFHALLLSLEIYNKLDEEVANLCENGRYRTISLLYHIVNEKQMTDPLKDHLLNEFESSEISHYKTKLNENKTKILYEFLHSFYINKIIEMKYMPFTSILRNEYHVRTRNLCDLMEIYNPAPPENNEKKQKNSHPSKKIRKVNHKLSDRELLRQLKSDKNKVTGALVKFEQKDEGHPIRINNFLKKIKVYFPCDLTNDWLDLFENKISKDLNIKQIEAAVYGIIQLANQDHKIEFMDLYAPKYDYGFPDERRERIASAICKFSGMSRPPVPVSSIKAYIKGSCVKKCVHIFYMFAETQPRSVCRQLVDALIDSPVSVQKHCLRLAFKCFEAETIIEVTEKIWSDTENISIRRVIYTSLFNKVKIEKNRRIFEVLLFFTRDIHEEDDDKLFELIKSKDLPHEWLGEFYEGVWSAVKQFKDKPPGVWRKSEAIEIIYKHINLMREDFVRKIVDDHINAMFIEEKLTDCDDDTTAFTNNLWTLTGRYIITSAHSGKSTENGLKLIQYITKFCTDRWDITRSDSQIYLKLITDFIHILKKEAYKCLQDCYSNAVPLFEEMNNILCTKLPIQKIYLLFWNLRITVQCLRIVENYSNNNKDSDKDIMSAINAAMKEFAKAVGNIVLEFLKNKQYFGSLSKKIEAVVKENLEDILRTMTDGRRYWMDQALTAMAHGLLSFEIPQTHILAVLLLPTKDTKKCEDIYKETLEKLERFDDTEVQCTMFDKFYCENINS